MDIKLPRLGEGAESGVIVSLLVNEGDAIEKNQPLIEIENEKAVAAIPSTAAGVVKSIRVKVGDNVSVGQLILTLVSGAEEAASATPIARTPEQTTPVARPPASHSSDTKVGPTSVLSAGQSVNPSPTASPSIRRLAGELGLDLTHVPATGRGGRIEMADLRTYLRRLQDVAQRNQAPSPTLQPAPISESIDYSQWGEITRKPLSGLRKVIARRMTENWTTIPHVTQFGDADVTDLLHLRKTHAAMYEAKGAKLTLTPLLLKALATTLGKHPSFNASLDDARGEIVLKAYIHIGIAVDTEAGLLVPVIRDVNDKTILQLAIEVEQLAAKARERKLAPEEMKGGTFTVSNQGGIGGDHFTPIINKPEVAILGLGRATAKPVAQGNEIALRQMLPLAVSYDHRLIDGGNAARFIVDLVQAIEDFPESALQI